MRGKKAKMLRATHQNTGAQTKSLAYFIGSNGMVLADRDRRIYQMRKRKSHQTERV